MEEKILTSIKALLGIPEEVTSFDKELVMHINSVFFLLADLGLTESFTIEDDTTTWSDYFIGVTYLEIVKTYIYMRVKLLFDPPQNSFLVKNLSDQIEEYGWRIKMAVENKEVIANATT